MLLLMQGYIPASPRRAYMNLRRQPTTDLDELALVLIAWWYND